MRVEKVLFVDDNPNVLHAFKRQLRGSYEIDIATSGEKAMAAFTEKGPYAVVVSDMQMPGVDGLELLQWLGQEHPNVVRLMLTGNADQETAIRAVNEGNVFRFLTKPCSTDALVTVLEAAMSQYGLLVAERELLEKTLAGSVQLLSDLLSYHDPERFRRSVQLRQAAGYIARLLGEKYPLDVELAALFSGITQLLVPEAVRGKMRRGELLSEQEKALVQSVPQRAKELVGNIPRLDRVAEILFHQDMRCDAGGSVASRISRERIPLGARILKALNDRFELDQAQLSSDVAERIMLARVGWYDPTVLRVLFQDSSEHLSFSREPACVRSEHSVEVDSLEMGDVLLADVLTQAGVLLVRAGTTVTPSVLSGIVQFQRSKGVKSPLFVQRAL